MPIIFITATVSLIFFRRLAALIIQLLFDIFSLYPRRAHASRYRLYSQNLNFAQSTRAMFSFLSILPAIAYIWIHALIIDIYIFQGVRCFLRAAGHFAGLMFGN